MAGRWVRNGSVPGFGNWPGQSRPIHPCRRCGSLPVGIPKPSSRQCASTTNWTDPTCCAAEIPTSRTAVAAWLCRQHCEVKLHDLSHRLGLSRADSVPDLTRRIDARMRNQPQLADEFQRTMDRISLETRK